MVETKVLKQLVRDIIEPQRDLGHSDRKGHKAAESKENGTVLKENTVLEKSKLESTTEVNVTSQFREVAEPACEDCQ